MVVFAIITTISGIHGDDQYDTCTNFYEKWMIHDVHIKPADEDSVDSIPASDAYCLCRGGISELDNKYR